MNLPRLLRSSLGALLLALVPLVALSQPVVRVGSKNFTEQFVLGEIYSQALQAAGYKVKKQLNLGSEVIAFKALKQSKSGKKVTLTLRVTVVGSNKAKKTFSSGVIVKI